MAISAPLQRRSRDEEDPSVEHAPHRTVATNTKLDVASQLAAMWSEPMTTDSMRDLRFNGANGRKASSQARRYIYERLAVMLKEDMYQHPSSEGGSFVLRHIDNEFDERHIRNEAKKVISELHRKATR